MFPSCFLLTSYIYLYQINLLWIKTLLFGPPSSSPVLLYSGGMPRASYGDRHCLTIQQDKEHVTLDFTSRVIDFFTVHSIEQEKGRELTSMNSTYLRVCHRCIEGFFTIPLSAVHTV